MYVWLLFLVLSAELFGNTLTAQGAESPMAKARGEAAPIPTTITSNKMTVRNQVNQAIFEGAVVLTRGPLIVKSDKMIVFFQAKTQDGSKEKGRAQEENSEAISSPSNRSLEKVEAIGHVKIAQENGHATCQKAVYFNSEEKIILTGDPVAWEKGTRVSGKLITIFLAEERSVVEGNSHVRIDGEEQGTP